MSEFYKGLRLPLAEQGKLLMLNENNEIISAQITENDVLNRTKLATTAPENPVEGDIYFDAANDKIMAYTGTAWVMQDRILNVTTDYEGTYAGSDCFHVNVQGNIVADETTFYVMFHRDANGIGNLDIAPGSYGALYLCNPDGTRIVASDVKEGMIVECIVKDTGGVPKYRAYLTQPLHHIANDLKGGSGYVLSAEQGKVLNEKIDTTKTELETNITNVETTLTQRIEESNSGLSGDVTALEERLDTKIEEAETTLNASIEANKTAIESNDADILDLQGKVGVNTTDIASLNTKVDDAVEGIGEGIAEVEARVTANETNIATNTSDIAERVTKTDAQPFIKDIAYDAETCTFTFTAYDNSTKVFDLPLENAVKSGYYDEEFDNLVLVLVNDTEIKIPAAALIDIYVGSEGNQIKVEVSKDNVITAILKADSVDESFLTEDLRNRLTTIEAGIKANKDSITTLNENAALYDASGDLPFKKDAILKINQKLLGSNPDGSTHVLAATLGWNIGTEDEFIQNEFGSSTIHTNLNSIDRPTIEMPTGKEEIAYKSELESAQADITAVSEEVKEIVDTEVASLKEKDTAIETEIAGLKTADTTIQETITTLEGKVDTVDNEIKASITTLEEKVDTKVEDLTNGISQNTTAIEANTTAIDTNKEAISTLDTELDTHIADFEAHKTESTTALNNKVDKNFGTMFVNTCDLMPGNDPDTGYSLLARAIGTYNPHSKASGTDVRAVRSKDGAVKFIQTSDVLQGMQEVIDLEILPENITFDAQETGLTSTKLPAAVREVKGLVDTNTKSIFSNTTQIESLSTRIDGVSESIDMKLEPIASQVADNTNAIENRVTKTEAKPFIKDIAYDGETCTFTFTAYDGTTKVFDLPLESAVKSGYYDAEGQNLVLVLMDETEIKIPATDLIDIYTGKDTDKISLKVNEDNSIEATIVEGSIAKTDLTTELQAEINGKVSTTDFETFKITNQEALDTKISKSDFSDGILTGMWNNKREESYSVTGIFNAATGNKDGVVDNGYDGVKFSIKDPSTGAVKTQAIGFVNVHSQDELSPLNFEAYHGLKGEDGTLSDVDKTTLITVQLLPEAISFNPKESGLTSKKAAAAIRELKGLVDTNTTNITTITTRVDNVESVIDTKLEPVEARITANETNIATNTQSIADLRAKDSELESSIATNVEALNNAIAEANKLIGENTVAIETNTTNITTNAEAIEDINTDLEGKVSWSDIGFQLMYSIEFTTNPNNALPAIYTTTKTSYNDGSHTYLYFKPTEDDLKIKLNNNTLEFSIIPEKIPFDAKESGLTSLKVPAAIREVKGLIDTNAADLTAVEERVTTAETAIATNTNNITANTTAITENKTAIAERVTKTEAKTFIKDVAYDGETCTFTFTMYDGTVETFDLPLESAVKTGRYDEDKKALILVLMDNTEIEIPADNLIDVYTGAEGNQINVSVSSANVISAILNADSIDESFLTEALRTRLTTMETNITNHTTALETVNTTLGNHTTEIAGIQEALANISMEASAITFDNTGTDLTATNVQEALVEINNKIGDILIILEEINGTQYENVNEEVF